MRFSLLILLLFCSLVGPATVASAAAVPTADLEAFFSLPTDTLTGVGNGEAIEGSGIFRTFTAAAGATLTFNYNFLTNEEAASGLDVINDFAFVSIAPGVVTVAADTFVPLSASSTTFSLESGYQTWSNVLTAGGTYTLQIGIVDVVDGDRDSALLIDDILVEGAAFANGGFEAGDFTGFSTIGDATVVDAEYGAVPFAGERQAVITTAVPEPTTWLLLAFGAMTCGLAARFRLLGSERAAR